MARSDIVIPSIFAATLMLVAHGCSKTPDPILLQLERMLVSGHTDSGDTGGDSSADTSDSGSDTDDSATDTDDFDGDGYSKADGDCDDNQAAVHPGADEVCDSIDNDCDNLTDDADDSVTGTSVFYMDSDGDGAGWLDSSIEACLEPEGYVANSDDYDDLNSSVFPGATEHCDGVDNDCDDEIDEEDTCDTGYMGSARHESSRGWRLHIGI